MPRQKRRYIPRKRYEKKYVPENNSRSSWSPMVWAAIRAAVSAAATYYGGKYAGTLAGILSQGIINPDYWNPLSSAYDRYLDAPEKDDYFHAPRGEVSDYFDPDPSDIHIDGNGVWYDHGNGFWESISDWFDD